VDNDGLVTTGLGTTGLGTTGLGTTGLGTTGLGTTGLGTTGLGTTGLGTTGLRTTGLGTTGLGTTGPGITGLGTTVLHIYHTIFFILFTAAHEVKVATSATVVAAAHASLSSTPEVWQIARRSPPLTNNMSQVTAVSDGLSSTCPRPHLSNGLQ
jgi:hypothetical protein